MNFPRPFVVFPTRPDLVTDNFYPPEIKIILYACDRLLFAIHQVSLDRNPHSAALQHWPDLWRLCDLLITFTDHLGEYLHPQWSSLPPATSPWLPMAVRCSRHYDQIPLSQSSYLSRRDP